MKVIRELGYRARERQSKRLRGETVDKHIMFDNPELVARRIRQATLGDSMPRAAAKQGRAVHFEQLLGEDACPEPVAQEDEEEAREFSIREAIEGEGGHTPAETPNAVVADSAVLPDSAGSGLNLTLSGSAAQRGSVELPGEQEKDRQQDQLAAAASASASVAAPPNTTGKLLARSKNSLEEAQSIAQGIIGSDPNTYTIGAIGNSGRSNAIGANPSVPNSVWSSCKQLPGTAASSGDPQALDDSALPSEARAIHPVSSVLASTTRPNVPSKIGKYPAQLKPPASASRLAHAGHTPHPAKSRVISADACPPASPQASSGVIGNPTRASRQTEGATPAATLRPFEGTTTHTSTANTFVHPVSNGVPIEDTPMGGVGYEVQHHLAPDSCMGQVSCLSMQHRQTILHSVCACSPPPLQLQGL